MRGFISHKKIRYPNMKSAICPFKYSLEIPIEPPPTNFGDIMHSDMEEESLQIDLDSDSYFLLNRA